MFTATWTKLFILGLTVASQVSARGFGGCQANVDSESTDVSPSPGDVEEFAVNRRTLLSSSCKVKYGFRNYAAYRPGTCLCVSDINLAEFLPGKAGACGQYNFDLRTLDNTVRFYGCSVNALFTPSGAPAQAGNLGCYQSCGESGSAGMWTPASGTTNDRLGECQCGTLQNAGASVDCKLDGATAFVFANQDVGYTASSQLARRKLKERLERRKNRNIAYCPTGLTACKVRGQGEDAFECIDTSTELESCGGCLWGQHGDPDDSPMGVNCDSIHEKRGLLTCQKGRCVAL